MPSESHIQTKHLHSAKPEIQNETKKVVERNSKDARERPKTVPWKKKNERREFNVAHTKDKHKDTSSDTNTTDSDTSSDKDTVGDMNNSEFFFLRGQTDTSNKDSETRRFSRPTTDLLEDEIDTTSKV